MIKPLSPTAFEYKGNIVDIVALQYANRKCGAGLIHKVGNQLCVLQALADEIWRGLTVDESEIGALLARAGIH